MHGNGGWGRRLVVAVAIVGLVAGGTSAGAATPRAPVAVDRAALQSIADRYRVTCQSPGAAVGLRTPDGVQLVATSGVLSPDVAITHDSQFLAGSVTKLFVATIAYQLIAEGRLEPSDPVARVLPRWPRAKRITVAMLLGHRSGMGDFGNDFSTQLRDLVLANPSREFRYAEVLDLVRRIPPVAKPGATYHYSNANTIVLGAILQRVTHRTLGELMRRRIAEPLGLTKTIYGPDDLAAAERVTFHGLFDVTGTGTPVDIGGFPRAAALTVDPAGAGLFSTIPDLLTFTAALFHGDRLVGPRAQRRLGRSVSTLTARSLLLPGRFVIHGHGGVSPGAQTIVAYDERSTTTVAVWCNRLDPGENELLPSVLAAKEVFEFSPGSSRTGAGSRSPSP